MKSKIKEPDIPWNKNCIENIDIGNGVIRKALNFYFDNGVVSIFRRHSAWEIILSKSGKVIFTNYFNGSLANISKSHEIRLKSVFNAAGIANKNGPIILFQMSFEMENCKDELWNLTPWKFEFKPFDTGDGVMKDAMHYHLPKGTITLYRDDEYAVWNISYGEKRILINTRVFLGTHNVFKDNNLYIALGMLFSEYGEFDEKRVLQFFYEDFPVKFPAYFMSVEEKKDFKF